MGSEMHYTVVDHKGKTIGVVEKISEAKDMHEEYFQELSDERYSEAYAGLCCSQLSVGIAAPVFLKEFL